jgi:hypothetical protein
VPFTISHAAAVIILKRRGLVTSALVIGSMVPDLAYFVHFKGFNRDLGHSIQGLFTFCLPVGLVILLVFHKFVKRPLFAMLPPPHQQRLLPYLKSLPLKSWQFIIRSLLSLGVGTLSHLAWDSFTHNHGFIVQNVAALRQPIFEFAGTEIFAFSILQHGSTLLGLAALVLWYFHWYRKTPVCPYPVPGSLQLPDSTRFSILGLMAGGVCLLCALAGFHSFPHALSLHKLRLMAERMSIVSMAVLSMEIALYCAIWHLFSSTMRYSKS